MFKLMSVSINLFLFFTSNLFYKKLASITIMDWNN